MTAPASWWRRNRLGLALLPVALAVALAAGSSRVQEYWWDCGFHEPASVRDGVAELVDEYDDGHLAYPIEARYSVASFAPVDIALSSGDPLPAGLRAWRLRLDVEADPSVALRGCSVAVLDTAGALHASDDARLDLDLPIGDSACVPADAAGPRVEFGSTSAPRVPAGEPARPRRFTTDTVLVLPAEAEPEAVRLWYFLPRYVELPVDGA